jgi:hypothetical protein
MEINGKSLFSYYSGEDSNIRIDITTIKEKAVRYRHIIDAINEIKQIVLDDRDMLSIIKDE